MTLEDLANRVAELEQSNDEIRQTLRTAGATIEGLRGGIIALTLANPATSYSQAIAAATQATDGLNSILEQDDIDAEYQQTAREALDGVLQLLISTARGASDAG